jgi:hypothetical protein
MKYDNKYITYLKQQNKKNNKRNLYNIILNLIQLIYKINFDKRQITIHTCSLYFFFYKISHVLLFKHKTNQDIISSFSLLNIYIYILI